MDTIGHLIPHKPPMAMLSDVLNINDNHILGLAHIGIDNPFIENGCFACSGAIEIFAQAAGALFGRRLLNTRASTNSTHSALSGVVVQLKEFELGDIKIKVGSDLQVSANYIGGTEQAGIMDGDVFFNQQQVFKGKLMIALIKDQSHD